MDDDCEASLSEDLYKERSLKKLIQKFKLCSSSDHFRNKNGIYESTVHRPNSTKRFKWIEEILKHQKQFKHDISKENFSIRLVKLYGQSDMFENVKKVFNEMSERNCERSVKSVNALLLACVNSRKLEAKMVVHMGSQTITAIISWSCHTSSTWHLNAQNRITELGRNSPAAIDDSLLRNLLPHGWLPGWCENQQSDLQLYLSKNVAYRSKCQSH
ncbi:unnamed protein product [Fraxinus pennsylvanica]|uniref:Pentatricopeptide repeat-containing protein n=1 Tax=Fraxinus pennsylvanica TaxID=56036 RepID=A0AAD1YNH7_9LAMI|nr:unnamed protein product [Fraxinus pennsylvanica]